MDKDEVAYNEEVIKQGSVIISVMSMASRKLHDVAWEVLSKNIEFCKGKHINAFGIMVGEPKDLPSNLRKSYSAVFLSNNINKPDILHPTIISVAKSSPAFKNGIKEGDAILKVNDEVVNKNIRYLLSQAADNYYLKVKILRNNNEIDFQIDSKKICGFAVQPMVSPLPTAYADGSKIFVTLAALNFIKDDSELAFIIGHELVHNVMHYKGNKVGEENFLPISINDKPKIRKFGDVFTWESQSKESEADLIGLQLSVKAGYNPYSAANYFRRLSTYLPELIEDSFFRVHLGNATRALDLDKMANKISQHNIKE